MAHRIEGAVVGSRFAFKVSDRRAPEPDVAYISPDRMQHVEANYMIGGPDIAVEIVSRESRQRDYQEKRELYCQADVREYWIIDPIQRRCEFLRLRDGQYEIASLEDNRIFRSKALPDFWLNIEWLIADSLPNTEDCLRQILTA